MQNEQTRIEHLERANRKLKLMCGAAASVLLLGMGMAMQAARDAGHHDGGADAIEAAVPVHDSTGFVVFARTDGNLIIVKKDGSIVRTKNQPLSVSF